MWKSVRNRAWQILSPQQSPDAWARLFGYSMLALIILSVLGAMAITVTSINERFGDELAVFETVAVIIFTIEYLARLLFAGAGPAAQRPIAGRLALMSRPLMIIDLLAILPYYLPFLGIGGVYLRVFRLMRLARLVKASRYSSSLRLLGDVVAARAMDLAISLAVLVLLLIVSAFVLYEIENAAQPDAFTSVPAALWWSVATLTTVGYGDIYPVTPLGKFMASIVAILGVGMVALPTGIMASGFSDALRARRMDQSGICRTCGRPTTGPAP